MVENEPSISEEELHAYVDGQIAGGECATVERWLQTHPEDAARVAAWRAQAEAIRARYGTVASEPVPQRFDLAALARGDRKWSRLAAAAVVLALLGGAAIGWFGRGVWGAPGPTQSVTAEAVDAHKVYVVEVRHPVEVPGSEAAHLSQWLSRRVGYPLKPPDLTPSGLNLVGGRLLPSAAGPPAAFFMYEGASGERYTIYCRRTTAPQSALRYRAAGVVGSFFWFDDDAGFVVSGPADRARLQKVAESVYEQMETRQQTGTLRPLARTAQK
jgi:anti-sigma factor RsiW